MSRAETKKISDGGPAKAIALLAPACGVLGLASPPAGVVCGAGIAVLGPGISLIADIAVATDRCSAFAVDPINKTAVPATAPCVQ